MNYRVKESCIVNGKKYLPDDRVELERDFAEKYPHLFEAIDEKQKQKKDKGGVNEN